MFFQKALCFGCIGRFSCFSGKLPWDTLLLRVLCCLRYYVTLDALKRQLALGVMPL